jgi:hypothetical protein
MAYINTKKRSEWEKSKRAEYKDKYKARHRANEIYKKAQVCSIKGCKKIGQRHHPDYKKPEDIIWLCEYHHKQIHRKYSNQCLVKGCENKHHSKGYCKAHYNKMKRGVLLTVE